MAWRLAQLEEEQQQAVALLALEQWPPPRLLWSLADLRRVPRRIDAPRLSPRRVEALLRRVDALQSLKVAALVPMVEMTLRAAGAELNPPAGLAQRARAVVASTQWAVRRPARDRRTARSSTTRSSSATDARPADPLRCSRSVLCGVIPP